jgi:hypothetical protein
MGRRFGKREFREDAPPDIARRNPCNTSRAVQEVLGKKLLVKKLDDNGQSS